MGCGDTGAAPRETERVGSWIPSLPFLQLRSTDERFLIDVQWDGKLIVRIIWAELLPVTGFWSRCFDTFNASRESQQRAAHLLARINTSAEA